MAARKGTSILVRRKTARLIQLAEMPRTTHHPTKTIGIVSHPYFSGMTIVTQGAQSPMINGTMVESAICPVVGFSGVIDSADSAQILKPANIRRRYGFGAGVQSSTTRMNNQ
jgi:hypothetical protein